jgi:hypothetical protein
VEREDDARGPRPASIICPPGGFLFLRQPPAARARPRGLYALGRFCPPAPARFPSPAPAGRSPASAAQAPRVARGQWPCGCRGRGGPVRRESLSANEKVATALDCTPPRVKIRQQANGLCGQMAIFREAGEGARTWMNKDWTRTCIQPRFDRPKWLLFAVER